MADKNITKNSDQIVLTDLANPQVLTKYSDYIKYLLKYDFINEANDLRVSLPILLEQKDNLSRIAPDFLSQYRHIAILAKFITLSVLSNREVIDLIENNLSEALVEPDLILTDKIKAKIVTIMIPADRDIFKRELREAMLRNNQLITSKNIVVDGVTREPTIGNWIKDYNKDVGAAQAEQINKIQYLTTSDNTKILVSQEKNKIETLINIYENLKKSSTTPEGAEEVVPYYQDNQHYVLREGKLELIKPDKILLSILEGKPVSEINIETGKKYEVPVIREEAIFSADRDILIAYQGDPKQAKAIAAEQDKLNKSFGGDLAKLRQEFFAAVQKKNVNRTIACLRLLTEKNDLENFLRQDEKLRQFLLVTWEKQYGADFAAQFRQNPTQIKFVRLFLRYILEERLTMPASEAARVGLQLANIFVKAGKKSYNKMAYFDVKDKLFHWFSD
ncbi:MAG: hypothetical protein A2729_03365 [Candidatus Buchananbacteria bacterium RIFCSPHIGHO2_01_FULL_39_14]|nr:MAG: hypothetical protein A2729_03365 [Candidatus Buchananbacteria bacterium RIFCSPHIGHO2_01_FULL_39_14]